VGLAAANNANTDLVACEAGEVGVSSAWPNVGEGGWYASEGVDIL